jgi:glutamate synthase (NADPH/NADH) small chain
VLEAEAEAGGMTRYGIPDYRLPPAALTQDVDVIASMGVDIKYNTRVGRDITLAQLHQDHDAVLIAVGLWMGRSTRVPGSDHPDVRRAVDLLRKAAAGESIDVPRSAVVIGGGNVAMDIARTLVRLQRRQYGQVQVTVTALEDLAHFLADPDEVKEALEEGIVIHDAHGPQEVVLEHGRVAGLRTWAVTSIFDVQGRFAPRYDNTRELIHPGEMVIEAIGQATDVSLLGENLTEALEWRRGRLHVNESGRTSEPWLWAAGDMVCGPDVVSAVADGHRVAESINEYLALQEQVA